MKLTVRHQTIYRYEGGSSRVAMLLKLKPRSHEGQTVERWQVTVNDRPVDNFGPNGQGNLEALWVSSARVEEAVVVAQGVVHTNDMAGIMRGLAPGADPLVYLRETPLTQASAAMVDELGDLREEGDVVALLHALSARVRSKVGYTPGITHSQTAAAQAFELGAGVCQDHAQIFIAKARALGIPARYVSGYLLASEDNELHETHAWAEAWVPALGWVGFDITNGVCVTDHYVRLACGLDAHDAAPIRGTALSAGRITVDADVRIDPSNDFRRQSQALGQQ